MNNNSGEPPSTELKEKKPAKINIYDCWCEEEEISIPIDYSVFDEYIKELDLQGRLK